MDLTKCARFQGVHPQTAYRWFREGTLPVPAVPAVRVDLDRQVARLAAWAAQSGQAVAQAATGAARYDISCDPVRGRWYIDASWRTPAPPAPPLDDLRASPVIAVDVNAGHLAVAATTSDGNILDEPSTIPLELAGLPATARDGRIRAAVTQLIATAKTAGARAVVIEDLDFAGARAEGRERTGNRPSHGKRGRGFRRLIGLTGPRRATRRPKTVRSRPPSRYSLSLGVKER